MAKRHEKILNLENKTCRMGKIANNMPMHGNEHVTYFTFPITGVMLTKDELNAFRDDKYCWSTWFESPNGKGQVAKPMAWWGEEDFSITPEYEADALTIIVSGGKELEFEAEEPESDEGDEDEGRPACQISRIRLKPQLGGLTEMSFSLTLRPGLSTENLKLQQHQYREIKLTLVDAKAKQKSEKQQGLPLGGSEPPKPEAADAAASTH